MANQSRIETLLEAPIKNKKALTYCLSTHQGLIEAVGVGLEPTRGSWLNTKSGGQPRSAELVVWSTLYLVYPVILTPETRGHVCRRVSSPHSIKNNYSAILKKLIGLLQIFQ